jgi:hypothetical protein
VKLSALAPDAIFEMYQREIKHDLLPVTSRKQYQIICKKIKKLMRIDRERVLQLIKEIEKEYGRRSALLEELNKTKRSYHSDLN